ncbi:terpene synthase family protein [Streptomyces spiramyceticus]|uniref:terpene synthase family protein n=1 Tax=Streptomyces spiramyceticus TaxID=299717 RepID=UPI00237BFCBC|nr:terpene synthase family protein [Streptomyces spiramyceticus]
MPQTVDLAFDIPSRMSPDVVSCLTRTHAWLGTCGFCPDEEAVAKFEAQKLVSAVARVWPCAIGDDLLLASKFYHWYAIFDDLFDTVSDAKATAALCHLHIAILHRPPGDPAAAKEPPTVTVFRELWDEARDGMSPAWRHVAIRNWTDYITAYAAEARARAGRREFPGVEDYLAFRRMSIAMDTCFDLTQRFYHLELPEALQYDQRLWTLRGWATDVISLTNDLFSVEKEERQGSAYNIIFVVERALGHSREEAVEYARQLLYSKLAQFHRAAKEFLEEGDHRGWTASEAITIYRIVDNMADYMRGLYDWQLESSRYAHPLPDLYPDHLLTSMLQDTQDDHRR